MNDSFILGYITATLLNGVIFYLLISVYDKWKRGEYNDRNE